MKFFKILLVITILIGVITLLLCIKKPTEPDIRGRVKYKGLYGKLVNIEGKAVSGAKVKAINVTKVGLQKVQEGVFSLKASYYDSVYTDSSGYYSFEYLEAGIYNLQGDYGNGRLVVLITGFVYDSAGATVEVKTDTLRAPGEISGQVNTYSEDNGGVLCYIPGTYYFAMTDESGFFCAFQYTTG